MKDRADLFYRGIKKEGRMQTGTRTCKGCHVTMPLTSFAKSGRLNKAGEPYRRYYCAENGCYWARKKNSPNGRMSKATAIREYKGKCSCVDCGYSKKTRGKKFTTWALQFHHHNSDKEANVGQMISDGYGLKRIFNEIKKCIVLCANCHMELHGHQSY